MTFKFLPTVILLFADIPSALGAETHVGTLHMTANPGQIRIYQGKREIFSLPADDGPWRLTDEKGTPSGRRLIFQAGPKSDSPVHVTIDLEGDKALISWNIRTTRPGRAAVHIPDMTYRGPQGFRYEAIYRDGRRAADEIHFDPLNPAPPMNNLARLVLKDGPNEIRFLPDEGTLWDFFDVRKEKNSVGQFEFSSEIKPGQMENRILTVALTAGEVFTPLDFQTAANMGLRDETEGDQKGGWTDQGAKDLRDFSPGFRSFLGVPFHVLEPQRNRGRSAIVLRGGSRHYFPTSVTVAVNQKFKRLYVLHTSAWTEAPGQVVADYTLIYEDGTRITLPVMVGRDIFEWCGDTEVDAKSLAPDQKTNWTVAWVGKTVDGKARAGVSTWRNPHPEKIVRSLVFTSKGTSIPGILAATVSSGEYQPTGSAVALMDDKLPLKTIRLCSDFGKQGHRIRQFHIQLCRIPVDAENGLHRVAANIDAATVEEPVAEDIARRLIEYVRNGGNVLIAMDLPLDEKLKDLLPFDPRTAVVARGPAKFLRLIPQDRTHPAFSGLPWDRDLYEYPIPPVAEYIKVGKLADSAVVMARWETNDPALITWKVGKGRVVYLAARRVSLEDYPDAPVAGYTAYFYAKLYHWMAGNINDAVKLGKLAEARTWRTPIDDPYAACRPLIQDALFRAQILEDSAAVKRLLDLNKALLKADERIRKLDDLLLVLDFDQDPAAGYRQIRADLLNIQARVAEINAALAGQIAARKDLRIYRPLRGYPMHVGFMSGGKDQREGSVWGEYRMASDFARGRTLGWDLINLFINNRILRSSQNLSEHAKFDRCAFENLDWLFEALRRWNFNLVPVGIYSSPPDRAEWHKYLAQWAEYLGQRPEVLALEPNNESIGGPDPADADFRAWLKNRFHTVQEMNTALGTAFTNFSTVKCVEMISAGGKRTVPKDVVGTSLGSPERALWYEYSRFHIEWVENLMKRNYEIIRSMTDKPINDRSSPIPDRNNGSPQRLERWVKWHDHLGTHVQNPYDLERARGYSEGKPLWLTEYYWNYWGGSTGGHRYRLHGNLMLPDVESERQNLVAVERDFWRCVARGTEVFGLYSQGTLSMGQWDMNWAGPCDTRWPDFSFKRPMYAFKYLPKIYNRIGGEIQGSHTESAVAIMEPYVSQIQTTGTILEKSTGSLSSEWALFSEELRNLGIQSDPRPPSADLTSYRYVMVPSGLILEKETMQKLLAFVQQGGTLLGTLATGLYDEHTRPDGTILRTVGVEAVEKPLAEYTVRLPDGRKGRLSPAAVFGFRTTPAFKGTVPARYEDGTPAWIDAPLGKGRIVLVGWAATAHGSWLGDEILPRVIDVRRVNDWTVTSTEQVDCFVRVKDSNRLFFITSLSPEKVQSVTLRFTRPHRIIDLRTSLSLDNRTEIRLPYLLPGDGRIFMVSQK